MKNSTKNTIKKILSVWVILGFIAATGCQKELTSQVVEKNIEQARKATDKAKEKAQAAIESRRQLYMQKRQARINEMESRVNQIDNRLASLNNISNQSPNQRAVSDVNSAMVEFRNEKDSVAQRIEQFKSISAPDWDQSVNGINQAIERIESELSMVEKSLDNK